MDTIVGILPKKNDLILGIVWVEWCWLSSWWVWTSKVHTKVRKDIKRWSELRKLRWYRASSGQTPWRTPGPNPINVFSSSIEAMPKFNQSVRLKMIMGPLWLVEIFSIAKSSVIYAGFSFIGLGPGLKFAGLLISQGTLAWILKGKKDH